METTEKSEQTEQKPEVQQTETAEQTSTQQAQESTEAQPVASEPPKEVPAEVPWKPFKIKHNGEEVELDEAQTREYAQKGFDYGKRIQSVQEIEKANQQKIQMAEQVTQDPTMLKIAMARQLGIDPAVVLTEPKIPDEGLKDYNPMLYGQQVAEYNIAVRQKQAIDQTLNTLYAQNAQSANNALFAKARIDHNLNDQQTQQVVGWMQSQLKPSAMGTFSEQQLEYAVQALFGKERLSEAKLKIADNIQTKIKKAVSSPSTSVREKEEPKDVKSASELKNFVKEMMNSK